MPTWCAHHADAWFQLSHMWDSDAWKAKNAAGRKNRLLVKSYHHQGSRSVSGYAEIYVSAISFCKFFMHSYLWAEQDVLF